MPDLTDVEKLPLAFAFLVPGFLTTYIYAQFLTGRTRDAFDKTLSYFVLTTLYYSIIYLFLGLGSLAVAVQSAWSFVLVFFAGPMVLGVALGLLAQKSVFPRLWSMLGVGLVHPIPSAWDFRFSAYSANTFVLVTLSDGKQVAGRLAAGSMASSDPQERDIYISELWDLGQNGQWSGRPENQGVLIKAAEIRYMEFWDQ